MEKVIRDGKVAVLYSPGYGAGWYTWHNQKELIFHPDLVRMVEDGVGGEITESMCKQILGKDTYVCVAGAYQLRIAWIPEGVSFRINEYDGAESVTENTDDYITA